MMIHVSLEYNSVFTVTRERITSAATTAATTSVNSIFFAIISWKNMKEITNLVSNVFSSLEIVNILQKKIHTVVSIENDQASY